MSFCSQGATAVWLLLFDEINPGSGDLSYTPYRFSGMAWPDKGKISTVFQGAQYLFVYLVMQCMAR